MDTDGSNARPLTQGDVDSSARFSPDGKQIAFVRTKGGDTNLFLLPLAGGEPRQLTNISTGVSDPRWSPNGKWIAFSTDVYPECNGDDACNKKISETWSKGKLQAHMADALLYRHWKAWKDGTLTHTWIVNVDSGETRDLTPGRFDFPPFQLGGPLQYDFSPDSSELAVASNHDPDPESSTNSDLWLIPLNDANARPRNITASNHGYDNSPLYSPDGRYIAYRTQLQPRSSVSRERPSRDHHERPRHDPAAPCLGAEPIADLAHVAGLVPAHADRAEHSAGRGVGDRERLLAEAADVRPCVLDRVRLRHHVEPA